MMIASGGSCCRKIRISRNAFAFCQRHCPSGRYLLRLGRKGPEILFVGSRRNGRWGLPKGHIEAGETSWAAARREALEEAGSSVMLKTNRLAHSPTRTQARIVIESRFIL